MDLPILQSYAIPPATADLLRYAHKLLREFAAGAADTESEDIDAGTALYNVALPDVALVNAVVDAGVPPGESTEAVIDQADAFFADKGVTCRRWVLNPSSPLDAQGALAGALSSRGLARRSRPICSIGLMALGVPPARAEPSASDFMIVPARAAYAQAAALSQRLTASASLSTADVGHLDDPRLDASLALRAGVAVGRVGVLTVGETGLLVGPDVVEIDAPLTNALLDRAIDYCRRAQLRHVFAVDGENGSLLSHRGFKVVGDFTEFVVAGG